MSVVSHLSAWAILYCSSLLCGGQCPARAASHWPAGALACLLGWGQKLSPACRHSGKYMFSFETWHERLLPEAWEHYKRQGDGSVIMDQQDELATL